MKRQRITLAVEVDLDPLPGMCSTPESWRRAVQGMLNGTAGAYYPEVTVIEQPVEVER